MRISKFLVGAVLENIPKSGLSERELLNVIQAKARTEGDFGWQILSEMNPKMFLYHLIHMGVLQLNQSRRLACPIPSLRDWLIKDASS